jgi:serine/threonine protein kinase
MVPNLRFMAPEVTEGRCCIQSDYFSVGCLIFYLISLNMGKNPHIVGLGSATNNINHKNECDQIQNKLIKNLQQVG